MRFKSFLIAEDLTGWGGSFERELSNLKGTYIDPITSPLKGKISSFKPKEKIKTKGYVARDKNVKSGMEGQIANTIQRLDMIREKIVQLEDKIGQLKEQMAETKSISQKEGLKRQIEGYNQQLKVLKMEATRLLKTRQDLIDRHNDSLQRAREEAQRKREAELQKKDSEKSNDNESQKKDSEKSNDNESPGYDPFNFGIEKPVKPDLPGDWNRFTESDVNNLKEYYNDKILYYEKVIRKLQDHPDIKIRGKILDYTGKIMNLKKEIIQLEKDWQELKQKIQKKNAKR